MKEQCLPSPLQSQYFVFACRKNVENLFFIPMPRLLWFAVTTNSTLSITFENKVVGNKYNIACFFNLGMEKC